MRSHTGQRRERHADDETSDVALADLASGAGGGTEGHISPDGRSSQLAGDRGAGSNRRRWMTERIRIRVGKISGVFHFHRLNYFTSTSC